MWKKLGIGVAVLVVVTALALFVMGRADGPVFIFAGGPFTSGELVEFDAFDWEAVDHLTEFEMEITGAETSRTLWFSVHDGVPYVACDLDCEDGVLARWPQQIRKDDRVVIRVEGQRVEGRLVYIPHDSPEYAEAKAARSKKYSPEAGGRAAAEAVSHGAVVGVGEVLTGRAGSDEPGDRLFRFAPR